MCNLPFLIVRDTREKEGHGWMFPQNGICYGTVVHKVPVGDYTIQGLEHIIAIERKESVTELAHNIIEKRWPSFIEKLAAVKHSYVLCEFSWDDVCNYPMSSHAPWYLKRKFKIPSGLIRKRIYEMRDMGIHVYFCGSPIRAEQLAFRLLKRAWNLYAV